MVQRARLALYLYRHPMASDAEVAQHVGQSRSWAGKWRRCWASGGLRLEDQPRSGRPWMYSPADRAEVIAVACELPEQRQLPLSRHSAASIQEVLKGEGIGIASGHVRLRVGGHEGPD
jgi:transposase